MTMTMMIIIILTVAVTIIQHVILTVVLCTLLTKIKEIVGSFVNTVWNSQLAHTYIHTYTHHTCVSALKITHTNRGMWYTHTHQSIVQLHNTTNGRKMALKALEKRRKEANRVMIEERIWQGKCFQMPWLPQPSHHLETGKPSLRCLMSLMVSWWCV